ncbi:MAG: tRNA pseudouridine(55) synthase TruB [Planctomycetota bacterium]|jgi:tRNA pseudouridine55 synthase
MTRREPSLDSRVQDPPPSGVINLFKPAGISSAQALYRVREITGIRKSGHAGTLDPRATGVLILCMGKGTKLVELVMNHPKVYRTIARLDVTSETLDLDTPFEPAAVDEPPSKRDVAEACAKWVGLVEQIPPRISAIKLGGKPAYERLRRKPASKDTAGEIQLAPRKVQIYWIHVHRYEWPEIDIEVCSGRGTYIRSLVRDIGLTLGAGGCITDLKRLRVGPFEMGEAWTIARLAEATSMSDYLVDLERARLMLDPTNVQIPARP